MGAVIDGRRGPARWLRAWALAATATAVGAGAHESVAGTGAAAPSTLVALALVSLAVAVPATSRRLRAWHVAALLLVDQVGVHLAMLGSHGTSAPSGHVHGSAAVPLELAPAEHGLTWGMLLAHAAVALVVGLAWARGEALLWQVARRLQPPSRPSPCVTPFAAPARHVAGPTRDALCVLDLAPSRGPPVRSLLPT